MPMHALYAPVPPYRPPTQAETILPTLDRNNVGRLSFLLLQHLLGRPISKTSVRTYMVALRALYTFLWQDGYTEKNLMQGYRMIRKEKHKQEVLTVSEAGIIDRCIDSTNEIGLRNWLIIHLMLDAGRSYDLMFWLGHSSLNTTQIYVDLSAACRLLKLDIYKIDNVFLQK